MGKIVNKPFKSFLIHLRTRNDLKGLLTICPVEKLLFWSLLGDCGVAWSGMGRCTRFVRCAQEPRSDQTWHDFNPPPPLNHHPSGRTVGSLNGISIGVHLRILMVIRRPCVIAGKYHVERSYCTSAKQFQKAGVWTRRHCLATPVGRIMVDDEQHP